MVFFGETVPRHRVHAALRALESAHALLDLRVALDCGLVLPALAANG